ncbi:hydrolase [Methyloversatilis discipulorum]|uniref:hydrolase n=1 Tax=Methyloversatilis discipulorum TaxID=1119528 RepID=UPI00313802EA
MTAPPPFRPASWLPGGHAQTIWPRFIPQAMPTLVRERLDTPDGDFVDIDWLPRQAAQPLVLLFHGLEGSSGSHYAKALMHALAARRWNGAVVHARGCSGEPNRLLRAYHSGDSAELDWLLPRVVPRNEGRPVYAVGVSLGGNVLCKWLGEQGQAASKWITAAASVCAPVDLGAAGRALDEGFNRVYTQYFLRTMKPRALLKAQRFPGLLDEAAIAACNSIRAFDDAVTSQIHGFRDADDYWTRCASRPLLKAVRTPLLLLQALNDPMVPAWSLATPDLLSSDVRPEYTAQGGHVGYVSGAPKGRLDWLPQRVLHFFDTGA